MPSRLLVVTASAAAVLYALQHPFSKPLASFFSTDLGSVLEVVLYNELILVLAFGTLLAVPAYRHDVTRILATRDRWKWLALLIGLGWASLTCYLFAVGSLNQVEIAILLNLPLAGAFAARVISKKPISGTLVLISLISAIIITASFWLGGSVGPNWLDKLAPTIAALFVPVIFAVGAQFNYQEFKNYEFAAPLIITNVIGGLAFAVVALSFMFATGHQLDLPGVPPLYAMLFVSGAIAATVLGRLTYQFAVRAAHGDSGAVGVYFAIIPGVAALVGYGMEQWLGLSGLAPNWWQLAGMPVIIALIAWYEYTRGNEARENP